MPKQGRIRTILVVTGFILAIGAFAITVSKNRSLGDLLAGLAVALTFGIPTAVVGLVQRLTKETKLVWMLVLCALAALDACTAALTSGTLCAVLPLLGLLFIAIIVIPEPTPGHCVECDYDLTGNVSGICPECGTPIEAPEK